uniref:3-ketodihydrosphingosine reductase n=1 Tax=Corethron hystrix TaxID=216773 RepID=A0A7S1BAH4_9STRA
MAPVPPGERRTVALVSSAAGQVGIVGYACYSPTKFALRGFAEALAMEMGAHRVDVTVAYPPDTDTPGYAAEMEEGKPEECTLISGEMGLYSAEQVGRDIVDAACQGRTSVYWGLEGWMLATLTAGMGPGPGPGVSLRNFLELGGQLLLMGILRAVSLVYLWSFQKIVDKCHRKRMQLQQQQEKQT